MGDTTSLPDPVVTADTAMNLASPTQLNIIDALRELGIAQFVALPQLAVVGDQSSGKSSVLESFSELPFPRDSGLCTRFATQIIFRRSPSTTVKVSIIPGDDRDGEKKKDLQQYGKSLVTLSSNTFLDILQEVCGLMGIPGPGESLESSQSTFSEDLLSIELSGPDKQNLSIIDIPGIFRTPTEGITTLADIELVRKIMYKHIKPERTVILAVIPSNTDIATQEILSIAKELDPNGLRTLGVLTKPDLIDKGGEENVMSLVEGRRNTLRLGYCIVRNRGQVELTIDSKTRHLKEKNFFSNEPWSRLDKDRVGTEALQKRLQQLLVSITRQEFPKVQLQIVQRLSDCQKRLKILGPSRASTDQQRRFLLEISQKFQDVTDCALEAYYSKHTVFTSVPELRIATLAVERMDTYAKDIGTFGHTLEFEPAGKERTTKPPGTPSVVELTSGIKDRDEHYPELFDLISTEDERTERIDGSIIDWIGEEYRKSRGFNLASIGPSILPTIWQEQSKNWRGLTLQYIGDIIFFVHDFIGKVLIHVCPDEGIRSGLWSILQEQLVDRYKAAMDHVKFVIDVEHFGTPLTTNHYFNENLQKSKTSRLENLLGKHAESWTHPIDDEKVEKLINLDQIYQSLNMDNTEHTIQDIHDILESYYKVARKRFVDTVCMQGSDHYLLMGPNSPLRLFSTAFVSEMSAAQLDLVAGEDVSTKQLRSSLEKEIEKLEKGKKLLRA